jgi:deoxyribose-phosphate aldolase
MNTPAQQQVNLQMNLQATARQALACLDLTSLNDGHDVAGGEADIDALCAKAIGPSSGRGPTAAVCVWPRLAARARAQLPAHIRVAAVANFPDGSSDVQRAVRDTAAIVDAGAQEVDLVMPYRDLAAAPAVLRAVRRACEGLTLKLILETGDLLPQPEGEAKISQACRIALDHGVDFLKTSTGKRAVSATPEAATLLLQAIAGHAAARGRVGFKPAGGIRTVADAALYITLTAQHLGAAAVNPARFRIGASGLLNDVEAVLAGADRPVPGHTY